MDRQSYIDALRKELAGYPREEVESAIEYVNEYYDETDSAQEVEKALGTPHRFAAQIKAEKAIEREKSGQNKGCGLGVLMAVAVGVLSLPISLPLVLALFGVVLAVVLAVFGVVVALIAVGVAIPVGIFVMLGAGIGMVAASPAVGFFLVGLALIGIGLGVFVILIIYWVIKLAVNLLIKLFTWAFQKIRGEQV